MGWIYVCRLFYQSSTWRISAIGQQSFHIGATSEKRILTKSYNNHPIHMCGKYLTPRRGTSSFVLMNVLKNWKHSMRQCTIVTAIYCANIGYI